MTLPMDHAVELVFQISLAVALAASCGLRSFLPILMAALGSHLGLIQLNEAFEWVASPATLVVFGVAAALELAGDKVPALDHALDGLGLLTKPAAGALTAAAAMGTMDPMLATVAGLILGAGTAGTVHLAKAKARVASTATTAGILNPFLSLAEDVAALAIAAAAILVPAATLIIAMAVVGLTVLFYRWTARVFLRHGSSSA